MWRLLSFFASLYFVQGAALAYIVNFQKPFLANQGVSKEAIGLLTSLLLIPFIAKVALGAVSDRFPIGQWGSRKPYMLLGLAVFAAGYGWIAQVNPAQNFALFASLSLAASFGLALFDTCADGWAVDAAKPEEQSQVQAAMIGGKSLGLITMSVIFGTWVEILGYQFVFLTLAVLAGLVVIPVLLAKVRSGVAVTGPHTQWSDLIKVGYVWFALFGVLYSISSFGTDGLFTLYLSEAKQLGSAALGLFGMSRGIGALVGAVGYAALTRILDLKRAQVLAVFMLGAGCLLPLMEVAPQIMALLWGFCWGFQETAFVTLAMRWSKGKWAATFFAIAMIFSNIGTSLGEALGAPLVPQFGYSGVFFGFAFLAWGTIILVPGIFRNRPA